MTDPPARFSLRLTFALVVAALAGILAYAGAWSAGLRPPFALLRGYEAVLALAWLGYGASVAWRGRRPR